MIQSSTLAACASLRRFLRDEGGATAIEYAMIAAGVSVAIVVSLISLGSNVTGFYSSVATALK